MPSAATTLANLTRANRHRWRARILEIRAGEVAVRTRDFARADRIRARAERAHLRATAALHGLTLAAA